MLGVLRRGGFGVDMAAHAYSLMDACVYGFALQEASFPFETGDPDDPQTVAIAHSIITGTADAYPHLAELTVETSLGPGATTARSSPSASTSSSTRSSA